MGRLEGRMGGTWDTSFFAGPLDRMYVIISCIQPFPCLEQCCKFVTPEQLIVGQ